MLETLQASAFAKAIAQSQVITAGLSAVHALGFAMVTSSALVAGLRTLGGLFSDPLGFGIGLLGVVIGAGAVLLSYRLGRSTLIQVLGLPVGQCRVEYRSLDAVGSISANAALDVWLPRGPAFLSVAVPGSPRSQARYCS